MLKYIFDAGDDVFSEIELTKVTMAGEQARVRVRALRDRTERARSGGADPVTRMIRMDVSLTFVREGGDWKLISEGPASDYLAASLLESPDADDRRKLLEAEPELLTEQLVLSMSRRAVDAAQMGNYETARTGYERMLEVARHIGHRKYEAEALQNLGNAYYFQRNFAAALGAYEQRLAIERDRGDDEGAAAAYGGIATIRYSLAEYGAALAAYREALAIKERLADEPGMATTRVVAAREQDASQAFERARLAARIRGLAVQLAAAPVFGGRAVEVPLQIQHVAGTDEQVIHLAVPFRINGGSALFSPLLLAGVLPGGDELRATLETADDASLDPREVMNLQLVARAIVLSDGSAMARRDAADGAPVVHWAGERQECRHS